MAYQEQTDFSRGLNTDQLGAPNSLLEATDIVVDRQGELRARAGLGSPAYGGTRATDTYTEHGYIPGFFEAYLTSSNTLYCRSGTVEWTVAGASAVVDSANATLAGCALRAGNTIFPFDDQLMIVGNEASALVGPTTLFRPLKFTFAGTSSSTAARWATTYRTGTITTTAGSKTITGSGTSWASQVEPGDYLFIDSGTMVQCVHRVIDVASDTSLTVEQAPDASVAGASYSCGPLGFVASPAGIFCGSGGAETYSPQAKQGVAHKTRLFVGNTREPVGGKAKWFPDRIRWSGLPGEDVYTGTDDEGVLFSKFAGSDFWQADAYADVYPGVGGSGITGMCSFASQLVIFKSDGVFVLDGEVASNGGDLGAAIRIVSSTVGAPPSARGAGNTYVVTPIGVAFANQQGLWLYDGSGLRNLCDGRIMKTWTDTSWNIRGLNVSCGFDRIFVHGDTGGFIIYDFKRDCFYKWNTTYRYTRILAVSDAMRSREETAAFTNNSTFAEQEFLSSYNSRVGYTDTGDLTEAYPRMAITTQPFNLGAATALTGRTKTIYINGVIQDPSTLNPELSVSLVPGRAGTTTGLHSTISVGALDEGTADKTYRFNVTSPAEVAAARVRLTHTVGSDDIRIYGIGMDYFPDSEKAIG